MDISIQVNRNWSALLQGICQAYEVMSITMVPTYREHQLGGWDLGISLIASWTDGLTD